MAAVSFIALLDGISDDPASVCVSVVGKGGLFLTKTGNLNHLLSGSTR